MTNHEKVANIVAFFAIMFGEDSEAWNAVMPLNPNYIIEKFERYVISMGVQYPWGMHPSLRNHLFNRYVDKWKLELAEDE